MKRKKKAIFKFVPSAKQERLAEIMQSFKLILNIQRLIIKKKEAAATKNYVRVYFKTTS